MRNHFVLPVLIIVTAFWGFSLSAQGFFPECFELPESFGPGNSAIHRFCVSQGTSDYRIVFSYQDINENVCDCEEVQREIIVARESFRSGNNYFRFSPASGQLSGTYNYGFGPGQSGDFYPRAVYAGQSRRVTCLTPGTCYEETRGESDGSIGAISGYTEDIREPSNFSATDGSFEDRIVLSWTRETDIPAGSHSYRIYRDGSLYHTVNGAIDQYTDTNITPNQTYTYEVSTYTTGWGGHESNKLRDSGSSYLPFLNASDGTRYNSVLLEWANMSNVAEEIRLERMYTATNGAEVWEELAVLSNNAEGYNDQTSIPGFTYTYHLTPINGTAQPLSDDGYSRPNGVIKGHVRSKLGVGVSGVDVTVSLMEAIPAGGAPYPAECGTMSYCATTNADGYYEIRDIYYHEEASFEIVPEKIGGTVTHVFRPGQAERTLDVNAKTIGGVDFTDETVFTVAGKVHYPAYQGLGPECGIPDVTILIDSVDLGIRTDATGEWGFALQDEGTYSFTPVFLHHEFQPSGAVPNPQMVLVEEDVTEIDFEDITTDSLRIIVQGSCGTSLGQETKVRITASEDPNCYNVEFDVDENGIITVRDLPARLYKVRVSNVASTNVFDQIGNKPVEIDLTVRDTAEVITEIETTTFTPEIRDTLTNDSIIIVQAADTVYAGTMDTTRGEVEPLVQFIYRAPLVITTDFAAAGATVPTCGGTGSVPEVIMKQGDEYTLTIEVKEMVNVDCNIDTGYLKIYDFISDRGNDPVRLPIENGRVIYTVVPGEPIIATNNGVRDHEKLLYIVPEVDLAESQPMEFWAFVEGFKANTPTYLTRTPDIPMLILHDPPGDNSYAFVEQGTTFESFTTTETLVGGEAGIFANLLLGAKIKTPFSGHGFGTMINFSTEAGRDNFNRTGLKTTMTFNETFSTSDLDNITGYDGDVYIGAAFNQEYSLSESLTFNPDSCRGTVDVVPTLADNTFATTFVYTELHIKNTLLPTFGLLRANILDGRDFNTLSQVEQSRVQNLQADSLSWENILGKNDTARSLDATFEENISFSAGAPIAEDFESSTTSGTSYEYNRFVNTEFALGAKIDNEGGIWFESELGVMGRFRWSTAINTGNDTTTTRKVGYVLDDGDIGDFFSVDILRDVSYDVPAFDLKLGTTSCPQEPGSQARDRPAIFIFPPERDDVPADGTATFTCQVTNNSESRETREYHVRTVTTTNPDGAILTLGGQPINRAPATFFLPYGETMSLELGVQRGPRASNYRDIGVMVYPPCEYELWQDNGTLLNADTAYIKLLNFTTECTNVSLRFPVDNWLVNGNSPATLKSTFSGYDLNNPGLESITLEIKREGEGFLDVFTVNKSDLEGANFDYNLDLTNYPDGAYTLRALANCGADGITYSTEKHGVIDRRSLAPFGYPEPSDGFLRPGGEVSVTFDQTIDCDFPRVGYDPVFVLTREDTGAEIPVVASCSGDKVILTTDPPLTERSDLDGVLLSAQVTELQDESGNVQKYPTEWSFLANVRPVFWDPSPIYYAGAAEETHTVTAVLKNNSLLSKPFSLDRQHASGLVDYPAWLSPTKENGTVLPNADEEIEFAVDSDLTPGVYEGVINALVDGEVISTEITVELLAEPVYWPFDPTNYEYSMTLVTTFSLDDSDTLLSEDDRDLIGAFVNGEIRGVTNIEYLPAIDQYRAFLTIYSNDVGGNSGEEISFRFWHALNGVEYGALETVTFVAETTTGTPSSPLILHPEGIFQIIPLNVGWNWVSLNVQTTDMSREHLLASIVGDQTLNDVVIKSQSEISTHEAGKSWNGNLKTLALGTGYLIHLSNNPDTLKVVGLPSPDPIPVAIASSWNWIGYPLLEPRSVNEVLEDINATPGDILKGQQSFSVFDTPSSGWLGNLYQFAPGNGYKLRVAEPGTIPFPASARSGYSVYPGEFEHNLSVVGTFELDDLDESSYESLEVVAFINGECRGIGGLEYCPSVDAYRTFLLVHGNVADYNQEISFRIVNTEQLVDHPATGAPLEFGPDLLIGSIDAPYPYMGIVSSLPQLVQDGYKLLGSAPNPTTGITTVSFRIPRQEDIRIEVLDLNGRSVKSMEPISLPPGTHQIQLDCQELPSGVYVYRLSTPRFSASQKLILR